jgi:hypothetical protein
MGVMSFFQRRSPYFSNVESFQATRSISVAENSTITDILTQVLLRDFVNVFDSSGVTESLTITSGVAVPPLTISVNDVVFARDTRTNYLMNPSFETNDLYWGLGGGSKAQSTSFYNTGKASLQFIGSAIDDKVYATMSDGLPSPVVGKQYTFSAYLRGSGNLKLWVYDGSADQYSASLITLTSTWTRYSLTITCGGSGMLAGLRLTTANAVTAYMDNAMFEEGDTAGTYFDGGTWGAVWSGSADQSTSSTSIAGTTIVYRSPLATLQDPQKKAVIHSGSYSIDTANNLTQTDINAFVKAVATNIPNTDYIAIGNYLDYVAQIRMWIYAIRAAGFKVWFRSAGYNDWRGSNGITQYTSADFADHSTSQYVSFVNTNYDIFQAGDIFEALPDEPENNSMWNTTYGTIGSGTGLTAYNTFITSSISQVNTALANNNVKDVDTGYIHTSPAASRDIITSATASVLTSMATDHYPEAVGDTTGTACGTAMHNELVAYVTGQQSGKRYHLTIGPNVNVQLSSAEQVNAYNSEWGYIQTDVVPLDGLTVWQAGGTGDPLSRLFDYASGAWTPRSAAATVNTIFGQVPQGQMSEKVTVLKINNVNVFDSSGVTDVPTVFLPYLTISVSDSSTVTDPLTQILKIDFVSVFDASGATDVITQILQTYNVNVFDSSTVTDPLTQILKINNGSVFDASTVTDPVTQILEISNVSVFDSSGVTDVITQIVVFNTISVFDSSGATDVLTQILIIDFVNVFDSSAVIDVPTVFLPYLTISVSDSSAATDVLTQVLIIDFVNVFDSSGVIDVPTVFLPSLTISLSESPTATDVLTQVLKILFVNVFDSSTATDPVTQILKINNVDVFDSSGVTDVITQIAIFNTIFVFEDSGVTESTTLDIPVKVSVFDSSTVTDPLTQILITDFVSVFDSSAVTDVITQVLKINNISSIDNLPVLDVRRNRVSNPSFETNTTGWSLGSNHSRSNDRGQFGSWSIKAFSASTAGGTSTNVSNFPVASGQTYTFSGYVYVVTGFVGNASLDIIEFDASGAQVLDGTNTNFSLNDQWERLSVTQTMNARTTTVRIRFVTDGNWSGTAYFDGAMLESGSTATTYIDGTQPGCSWDGTANASTSSSTDVTVIPEIIDFVNVFDSSAVTEDTSVSLPFLYINTFDSSALTESLTIEAIDSEDIVDSSTVTEFVAIDIPIILSVFDSSTVTDVLTQVLKILSVSVSDSSTVTDPLTQILITDFVSVFDSSAVTDVPTVVLVDLISTSDSSGVTDVITQVLKVNTVNVFDASTVTDPVTQILLTNFINVADASGVTDVITQILKTNYVSIKVETVGVSERSGYGLAFNGGTSAAGSGTLTVANQTAFQTLTSLTVEAWVYMQEISTTLGRVVDYQRSAPTNDGFFMWCNANHAGLSFGVIADNVSKSVNTVDFSLNTWHHIAGTWDGSTVRVFVDGVLSNSIAQTGSSTSNPAHGLLVGNSGGGRQFPGIIDEVRVSDIARYTSNFSVPTSEFTTDADTLLLLHMNDASGTTVVDTSGNGFNGSIAGTPLPQWVASGAPINLFLGQVEIIDSVSLFDTSGVTESITVEIPVNSSVSDASAVTESLTVIITDFIAPSDSSIVTENFGYSLHIDGVDDQITLAVSGFESQIASNGLYIKIRIRSTASAVSFLYGDKTVGSGGLSLQAYFDAGQGQNVVGFGMQDNTGANRNGILVQNVLDGQVHIIEVTYPPTNNALSILVDGSGAGYINGANQGQGNTTYNDFRVGLNPSGTNGAFDIDYLLLGRSDGTKTAEFLINDGYSTSLTDLTGHGNTATIVDSTWTTPLTNATNVEIVDLVSLTETTAVTDVLTQTLVTSYRSVSDSSAVTESLTVEIIDSVSLVDTSTVTEDITVVIAIYYTIVSEDVVATDVLTQILQTDFISTSDSSVITDVLTQVLPIDFVSVFDSSTVTEAVAIAPFLIIDISDSSAVTEASVVEIIEFEDLFDTSTVTEFVTVRLTSLISVFDTSAATDVLTQILKINFINKAEVTVVTDTLDGQNGGIYLNPLDISVFEALGPYFLIFVDGRPAIRLTGNFYTFV